MITISEVLIFVYLFVVTWLLHELFHIKSQGLTMGGSIHVSAFGFTATADDIKNYQWFLFAGGILSSIVSYIVMALSWKCNFTWGLLTVGTIQLAYGLYEGITKENKTWLRYLIYIGITLLFLAVGWLYW